MKNKQFINNVSHRVCTSPGSGYRFGSLYRQQAYLNKKNKKKKPAACQAQQKKTNQKERGKEPTAINRKT